MVHDVGLAEELAQDALVAALEQWPRSGVPENPGAWLTAIAKRRAVDHIRRARRLDEKHHQLAHEQDQKEQRGRFAEEPDQDDALRLMFLSCHPVLPTPARVALTLRLLGGLTAGRSPGPSSSPRPRSPVASPTPNAGSPRPASRLNSPTTARNWLTGSPRSSKSST